MLSEHLAHHANTSNVHANTRDAPGTLPDDTDEDLKIAIELSLIEARSQGHAV